MHQRYFFDTLLIVMNKKKEKLLVTRKGLEKLKNELEKLEAEGRKKVADQINEAASQGDISDSFDYDEAKRAQGFLEGKIAELKDKLSRVEVVEEKKDTGKIQIGSNVTIEMDGRKEKMEIVGVGEKDPSCGKISYQSPLGKALLGKKGDDEFEFEAPKGAIKIKIITIS